MKTAIAAAIAALMILMFGVYEIAPRCQRDTIHAEMGGMLMAGCHARRYGG